MAVSAAFKLVLSLTYVHVIRRGLLFLFCDKYNTKQKAHSLETLRKDKQCLSRVNTIIYTKSILLTKAYNKTWSSALFSVCLLC